MDDRNWAVSAGVHSRAGLLRSELILFEFPLRDLDLSLGILGGFQALSVKNQKKTGLRNKRPFRVRATLYEKT